MAFDDDTFCPGCGVMLESPKASRCRVCGADVAAVRAGSKRAPAAQDYVPEPVDSGSRSGAGSGDAELPFDLSVIDREGIEKLPEKPPAGAEQGTTVRGYISGPVTSQVGRVVLAWQSAGWLLDSHHAISNEVWELTFRYDPVEAAERSRRAKRIGLLIAVVFVVGLAVTAFVIFNTAAG